MKTLIFKRLLECSNPDMLCFLAFLFCLLKTSLYVFSLEVFWLWFSRSGIKKRSDYKCGFIWFKLAFFPHLHLYFLKCIQYFIWLLHANGNDNFLLKN